MHDRYVNPLCTRYAGRTMQHIYSDDNKFSTWRRLWVALAESEQELGLPITDEQIRELRAHITDIDYDYAAAREHYLSVPPGLTGLWQVSGRNDMDYDERVQLDRQYVDNWNVWTDFTIVMRTVGVMVGRKGAY